MFRCLWVCDNLTENQYNDFLSTQHLTLTLHLAINTVGNGSLLIGYIICMNVLLEQFV